MATITKYPQSYTASAWTNPTNAYSNNGVYATVAPGLYTNSIVKFYNFQCAVPAGATINSVTAYAKWKISTSAAYAELGLQPRFGASAIGSLLVDYTPPTTDETVNTSCGTWSLSNINLNTTSGLVLEVQAYREEDGFTASLDAVWIVVDYTPLPVNYNVTAAASNGVVTAPTTKSVAQGATVTFPVTPNAHYHYSSITGNGSWAANVLTITNVQAQQTSTVNFVIDTYNVTAAAVNGSVTAPATKVVNWNGSVSWVINPTAGYEFGSISGNGSYNTSTNTLTINNVAAIQTTTVTFVPAGYAHKIYGVTPAKVYNITPAKIYGV